MKVVALHTDFRIYWPSRLAALKKELNKRGDSLEIIEIAGKGSPYSFAHKNNDDEYSNWHILFPDSKPEELSGKTIKPVLFDLLDKINPDIIIAGAIAFHSGALGVQWANAHKDKRVIIFDDSKYESVKRNCFVDFIKQNIYNRVDAMFYPAEQWIDTGNKWGFTSERIFFGVDVVDNSFWTSDITSKIFDFPYFIMVGRQIPQKNYISVLKAYKKYIDSLKNKDTFKLVLVGEGPEQNNIKAYIEEEKLFDNVILMPFMSQPDLRDLLIGADILISCSRSETWGLVINEAMCCKCAIIASKQCGATDSLVHQNVNGYVVDCEDLDGIAKAMIDYHLMDIDTRDSMKQNSLSIISKWGLEKFSNGLLKACDFVISKPKRKNSFISKVIINNWHGQYNPI